MGAPSRRLQLLEVCYGEFAASDVADGCLKDVQVMSRKDWERQRAFKDGHLSDVTALAWSPNGALLATAGTDHKICLWDTKSQKIIKKCPSPISRQLSHTNKS